jgi:hypothetical protein
MFVFTVECRTTAADIAHEHVRRWHADVEARAVGWLGNTAGVSTDGDFIMLLRFESEEAAYITSDLPEYEQWWRTFASFLDTKPVFKGSTSVMGILSGGSDDATAVRITKGHSEATRLRDSIRRLESLTPEERATIIGGIVAWHDRDRFTEALYLTSQDLPRFRQRRTARTPLSRFLDDHEAIILDRSEMDLYRPWLVSARSGTFDAEHDFQ